MKFANLPNGCHTSPDERVTIQVPTVKSDLIAVERVLKQSEALLIFSPKPHGDDVTEVIGRRGYSTGQVFMVRTRLISDNKYLNNFAPEWDTCVLPYHCSRIIRSNGWEEHEMSRVNRYWSR